MGSVLAGKFSLRANVCVFINEFEKNYNFSKNIEVVCEDTTSSYFGNICLVTENIKEAVEFGDYIFITYPAFLFEKYSKLVCPLLRKGQHLVFVPGSGGAEIQFKEALDKGATITGLQRVHSVARLIEPGKKVKESGIRKSLKIASIPSSFNEEANKVISELYGLPLETMGSYLDVTLVNSNPILHTSRLYSIFKDYKSNVDSYESLPLFYEHWDLETSNLLVAMDQELFDLIEEFNKEGIEVNQIITLLEHYESTTPEGLTKKLNSINSLKGLTTPNVFKDGKYYPDLNSRYFTADFPYGLDILLSFCQLFNIECDNMLKVSDWYHRVTNTERTFSLLNYFKSKEDLLKFYKL